MNGENIRANTPSLNLSRTTIHEKTSPRMTTHLSVGEGGSVASEAKMVTVRPDRIAHHDDMLETDNDADRDKQPMKNGEFTDCLVRVANHRA